jgi:hypothetical protein
MGLCPTACNRVEETTGGAGSAQRSKSPLLREPTAWCLAREDGAVSAVTNRNPEDDVLDPQANLCSLSRSRRITKRRVAELVNEWGPGGQWAPLHPDNDDDQEW